ncbi:MULTISPECIES: GNAT family acetyltransferase [unclassified Brevundimonas]|uniref:GNAT family acetyltransferase n=1 Tax=unclassified Brevundimonas TaxID=2622653 RepID=UPI0025C15D28|nr:MULTISPECIES: GNAT family acetyltransferase [unclassified Brevundimonas]
MTLLTRIVFGGASLLLLLLALGLVFLGMDEAPRAVASPDHSGVDALLDVLGYVIVAIAVFDVAKYLFEEEVQREKEKRSAAEARRSLTKFLSTIVIAVFLEALVVVFKTAREDVTLLIYPTALLVAAVIVLVGLGAFQRFSAAVEEKVGVEDEAADRADAAKAARRRTAVKPPA